jgi:hypothetical protein
MRDDPEMQARKAANMNRLADVQRAMPLLYSENLARHKQIGRLKSGTYDHIRNQGLDIRASNLALAALLGCFAIYTATILCTAITGPAHANIAMGLIAAIVVSTPIIAVIRLDQKAVGQISQHLMIALIMLSTPAVLGLFLMYMEGPVLGPFGLVTLFISGPPAALLGTALAIGIGYLRTRRQHILLRQGDIALPENGWEEDSARREELI